MKRELENIGLTFIRWTHDHVAQCLQFANMLAKILYTLVMNKCCVYRQFCLKQVISAALTTFKLNQTFNMEV